ncbi:MAG: aldehyde dehydrogenase EutE [Anaerolineae bacterium]|jgi:acyl-CoA reductase-like NAD-dependent aldehyde dehydrogenase|nr:aldehyde dehydrogenase EutE [Anaerolineae bacterium]MDX9829211.1 aldehyde dehydrogenase EutE [Anaerolineae bacterium]
MVSSLDERRIAEIVQRVVADLHPQGQAAAARPAPAPAPAAPAAGVDGVYGDVDAAVAAARIAQERLGGLPLERRAALIAAMRRAATENAPALARAAWQETGMGRPEDKVEKNLLVAERTPGTEALQAQAWTGDRGLTLVEVAPYGVVGAITPSTNPTSTIICNAIGMIAAGNAAVFNAHPGAKACSAETIRILNRAIKGAGGPPDLLTCPAEPTIESAQRLMHHPSVRLLVVTGGPAVVREAMGSGKKAICAGPGNPPVVVDETADLEQAARDIVKGASFDNNVVCILEKEIIAVDAIADRLKSAILARGAVEIGAWQLGRLMKVILAEDHGPGKHGVVNKAFVGKSPRTILREIGVDVEESVRLVIAETDARHPLVWTEQLMPVMPLVRVGSADEAIDLARAVEQGMGHTAVMHSKNLDALSRMSREINTSIFVKNGPSLAGLGFGGEGYTSFSIASPTGEGLTSARNFARMRRCVLVDAFRIV